MKKNFSLNIYRNLLVLLFVLFSLFWLFIYFFTEEGSLGYVFFTNTYGIFALFGGIFGLFAARKWGGYKSSFGRSILMLSFGLLLQELGQLLYMYYIYFQQIEVPYPSLGDIGFFGSIFFYIYAAILLFKMAGANFSLKEHLSSKIEAIVIPAAILLLSYWFFLRGYVIDSSQPLKTILDFGYPLFQSVYVSIALVTYRLSRFTLGGQIKGNVFLLLAALFTQYLCDFVFLYRSSRGIWVPGGINDYMYLVSYFLMTLAIMQLYSFFIKVSTIKSNA
jgi:hypothetical protein